MKKRVGGGGGGEVGLDNDLMLRTQTPSPNLLKLPGTADMGENLLGTNQPLAKQAITTDDEILAKLMLKINNIENKLTKFKVSGQKN